MRKYLRTGLVLVTLAMALLFVHFGAFGKAVDSTDPIFGTWKMDQAKSQNNRGGDHAAYPTQHMRILASEADGLRNTLSYSPMSSPTYSYSAKFDGKDHPGQGSDAGSLAARSGFDREIAENKWQSFRMGDLYRFIGRQDLYLCQLGSYQSGISRSTSLHAGRVKNF
jgi:hypothetical protein